MQRGLGMLIRSTALSNKFWIRGPKKAKVEAGPTSDDLINIWKDRKDPEIKDIDEYPIWLLELALPIDGVYALQPQLQQGDKVWVPPASHMPSIIKGIQRDKIQQMNIHSQVMRKGDVLGNDDQNDQEDQLMHIQQEKMAAEAAAEEAARLKEMEEDDEDAPKAKKPVIKKDEDEDDKPAAAGKAGDKAAAGKGAAGGAAGGADAKGGKKK